MLTRALALLSAALLFHLSLFALDRACAESAPVTQHEAGHEHHAPPPTPTQTHDAPAKCCDALSACGVVVAFGSEISGSRLTSLFEQSSPPPRVLLSTAPRAPEPPPPRA